MYLYTIIFDIEKLCKNKRYELYKLKNSIVSCNNFIVKKFSLSEIIEIYNQLLKIEYVKLKEVIFKKFINDQEREIILSKIKNYNFSIKSLMNNLDVDSIIYFSLSNNIDFPYGLIDYNKILIFSKNIDQLHYLINIIENTEKNLRYYIGKKILFI